MCSGRVVVWEFSFFSLVVDVVLDFSPPLIFASSNSYWLCRGVGVPIPSSRWMSIS